MKALNTVITTGKSKHYALLYLILFGMSLIFIRVKISNSFYYLFLVWNLFLALLPLAISYVLMQKVWLIENKLYFYPILILWLLLLPNAPYIITDFIHLQKVNTLPVWYDALLITVFATAGMASCILSMKQIFTILSIKITPLFAKMAMIAICLLSGFGLYVGRVLRFNSWDIITNPLTLITTLFTTFFTANAIGYTLGFGCFIYLLFHFYSISEQ